MMFGTRGNNGLVALFLVATLIFSAGIVCLQDKSDAKLFDNVIVVDENSDFFINADSSQSFVVSVYKKEPTTYEKMHLKLTVDFKTESGNKQEHVSCSVSTQSNGNQSIIEGSNQILLVGDEIAKFTITTKVGLFASEGKYKLSYTLEVKDPSPESILETITSEHVVTIGSPLSTTNAYNKFLGIFENNLSQPFNSLWFTALVTFFLWIAIGQVVMLIAIPIIMRLSTRKGDPDAPTIRRSLFKWCTILTGCYAAVGTLSIMGLDERLMLDIRNYARLLYLLIGIMIVWRIYTTTVEKIADRMRGRDLVPGGEVQSFDSFKPLFLYIGKIILCIVGLVIGLGLLGVDLAAIITSAGVVTLGITFGAQQVLSQFFSGLVILSTRPFKKGDLIQIGTNTVVYRVRKVNVMNTELENWDNSDITIVPNNAITANNVKNITRDTLRSKVHLYVDISYDSDIPKARQILLDCANQNPRIIKDGSVSRPSTRLTEFGDSNIVLRLTFWVDDYNDHGGIAGDMRVAIFEQFKREGINIDYTHIICHYADKDGVGDPDVKKDGNNARPA